MAVPTLRMSWTVRFCGWTSTGGAAGFGWADRRTAAKKRSGKSKRTNNRERLVVIEISPWVECRALAESSVPREWYTSTSAGGGTGEEHVPLPHVGVAGDLDQRRQRLLQLGDLVALDEEPDPSGAADELLELGFVVQVDGEAPGIEEEGGVQAGVDAVGVARPQMRQ